MKTWCNDLSILVQTQARKPWAPSSQRLRRNTLPVLTWPRYRPSQLSTTELRAVLDLKFAPCQSSVLACRRFMSTEFLN